MIYVERQFSQKLERTEALVNVDFVETRARLDPGCGAAWIEVGGAYAMFDGVESPLTQTFGLGLFEDATPEHLNEIEAFFGEHDAPVFHEVSPMTDPSLLPLLNGRGYQPVELTSVMYRSIGGNDDITNRDRRIITRVIMPDEVDLWARTSAAGWMTEHESLADFMFTFGRISAQCAGAYPYLAELDGVAISTGMMFVHGEVAMLAGASTIPDGRNKGSQSALFHARLAHAEKLGCTLAVMGASPGSQSQKNAQKNGFNIAYTRTKWQLMV